MRHLVKTMLDLEPKNRPTLTQVLAMPFLRKHIKHYVHGVVGCATFSATIGSRLDNELMVLLLTVLLLFFHLDEPSSVL